MIQVFSGFSKNLLSPVSHSATRSKKWWAVPTLQMHLNLDVTRRGKMPRLRGFGIARLSVQLNRVRFYKVDLN